MRLLLTSLLLLLSSMATATETESMPGVTVPSGNHPLVNKFVFTMVCSSIVNGGEALDGENETKAKLAAAGRMYAGSSLLLSSYVIDIVPGWENETFESMADMVVDQVREWPIERIQLVGEACMSVYSQIQDNKDVTHF